MDDSGYESQNTTDSSKDTITTLQDILQIKTSLIQYQETEHTALKKTLQNVQYQLKLSKETIVEQNECIRNLKSELNEQKQRSQSPRVTDNSSRDKGDTITSRNDQYSNAKRKPVESKGTLNTNKDTYEGMGGILKEWGKQSHINNTILFETHMKGLAILTNGLTNIVNNLNLQTKLNNITTTLTVHDLVTDYKLGAMKINNLNKEIEKTDTNDAIRKKLFILKADKASLHC